MLAGLSTLSSCFTGIESTPRITESDVKRQHATTTDEDRYLSDLAGQPLGEWQRGKRFYVADNKINILFGATVPAGLALQGKIIEFDSATPSTLYTGEEATDLAFMLPDGSKAFYRVKNSPSTLEGSTVDVPFTIEETVVEEGRRLLAGKELYITTSVWRDSADRIIGGHKFVPVRIENVTFGTANYPIRADIVSLSDSARGSVFIVPGRDVKGSRTFASQFSLTDPRLRYPSITDDVWELIIRGRVKAGMTRDECRLSLGAPANVDRMRGYSSLTELWTYENGIYLVFEDGLLKSFRR